VLIDNATADANNGKQLIGVLYRLYEATVTIPLSTDNLNLVNYEYCRNSLEIEMGRYLLMS
jgi:hypothetical protein